MEILTVAPSILKIKAKKGSLLIVAKEDLLKSKVESNMTLLLKKNLEIDLSKIDGNRLIIKGPGDYEVSEIKISSFSNNDNLSHIVGIDSSNVLISSSEMLKNSKNLQDEYDIVILFANSDFDESLIASLSPKILILFGENKDLILKQLGKEGQPLVQKYQIKTDKLPVEMEVVVL